MRYFIGCIISLFLPLAVFADTIENITPPKGGASVEKRSEVIPSKNTEPPSVSENTGAMLDTKNSEIRSDDENIGDTTSGMPVCNTHYSIVGKYNVKKNTSSEYSIKNLFNEAENINGDFTLSDKNGVIETISNQGKYVRHFLKPGRVTLSVRLPESAKCSGILEQNINIYKETIVYLGLEAKKLHESDMAASFEKEEVLFQIYDTPQNFSLSKTPNIYAALNSADIIILQPSDILGFFRDIEKMQRGSMSSYAQKKIYIISPYSRTFLSKVLASSLAKIGVNNASVLSEDQLQTLLARWYLNDNRDITLGEKLSYENRNSILIMNTFLEYLAYSGFSYQFLAFILSLAFVALILNIFKQMVGLYVFSIYYPILLAVIWMQMGTSFTFIFTGVTFLSVILTSLINNKIHLLINARRALLISLYILLILLALGIDNLLSTGLFYYDVFDNPLITVALVALLFITEKMFENINIFSRSGLIDSLQYVFVIVVVYAIIGSKTLQYFFISYPDSIFAIVLLNLLVGRYTGLQLFEYVRFEPILRKLSDEEE